MDYQAMGTRIRTYRKKVRLTQTQLAEAIGVSTSFVGHIERGSRVASIETLVRLSSALNVSLDALVIGMASSSTDVQPIGTMKIRVLNDVLRVLNEHANEWLHD